MKIKFITGVMGSGKSAKLIEDAKKYKTENGTSPVVARVVVQKTPKYGSIHCRNGKKLDCLMLNIAQSEAEVLANLTDYINQHSNPQYLLIDEIQFLNGNQINAIETAADIFGLKIRFYGLATDFTGAMFSGAEFIEEIADDVIVISSKCEMSECDNFASFNARFNGDKVVVRGETIVEDKNTYKALCGVCFCMLQQ